MAVQTSKNKGPIEVREAEETIELSEENEEVGGFKVVSAEESEREVPFPSKVLKAEDSDKFFEWVNDPTVNWTAKTVYAYRQWPIIDRRKLDAKKPIYIDVIGSPFTLEDFLQQHGGGRYKFIISDSTKAIAGKGGAIGTAYLTCMGSNYPDPILLLEELVLDARENRAYIDKLVSLGKLASDGRPMVNNPAVIGGPATVDPNVMALLTELIRGMQRNQLNPAKDSTQDNLTNMFVKTHETSLKMLQDQIKGDDPEKWLKIAVALVPLIQTFLQKPDTGTSIETLLRIQSEAHARETNLMMEMMKIVSAKKEDESNFDRELERVTKIKELFGDGGGGRSGGKQGLWETAIEYGAPIVGKALDAIMQVVSIKNYEAGLKMQNPPVARPAASGVVEPVGAIEDGKVVEMPKQPEQTAQQSQFGQILRQYGGLIINALNTGQSGEEFAGNLEGMFGQLTYDQIAVLGKEGILAEMKAVPEFWGRLAAVEPKVEKFVEEFIEYGKEEAAE